MNKRQDIVDILVDRLKSISIANEFKNDIAKVDEWTVSKLNDKDMPALILRDTGSIPNNNISGSMAHKLKIEVDVLVSDKDTTMATLRTIMQDVLKAIGGESDDLPEYRTFEGDEILAEHQDKFYGGARMKFTITYDTANWEL